MKSWDTTHEDRVIEYKKMNETDVGVVSYYDWALSNDIFLIPETGKTYEINGNILKPSFGIKPIE